MADMWGLAELPQGIAGRGFTPQLETRNPRASRRLHDLVDHQILPEELFHGTTRKHETCESAEQGTPPVLGKEGERFDADSRERVGDDRLEFGRNELGLGETDHRNQAAREPQPVVDERNERCERLKPSLTVL